jgi:Mn-dependent DtxR family transcriptional regulator
MEYICKICNYKTDRSHNLKLHNTSIKHLKKSGLIEYEKHKNIKI